MLHPSWVQKQNGDYYSFFYFNLCFILITLCTCILLISLIEWMLAFFKLMNTIDLIHSHTQAPSKFSSVHCPSCGCWWLSQQWQQIAWAGIPCLPQARRMVSDTCKVVGVMELVRMGIKLHHMTCVCIDCDLKVSWFMIMTWIDCKKDESKSSIRKSGCIIPYNLHS